MVTYKHSKNGDLKFSTNGKKWQRVYSQTKCSKVKVSAAFSKFLKKLWQRFHESVINI